MSEEAHGRLVSLADGVELPNHPPRPPQFDPDRVSPVRLLRFASQILRELAVFALALVLLTPSSAARTLV